MENSSQQRRTGPAIAILLAGIVAALLLDLFVDWQVALVALIILPVVGAYVYAGWERAWFVGLFCALLLALVTGPLVSLGDGTSLRLLTSGLLTLIPALLAAMMMFIGATEVLVIWRCGENYNAWKVMTGLLSMTLGRARTLVPGSKQASFSVQVVSKGQIVFSKPLIRSRPILGPGIIVVESGNALLLEKNGKFTRIVGPGVIVTAPYEAISSLVDLRLQITQFASQMQVLTKDGIPLELSCTVQYRIHGDEQVLIDEARYKLDETAIRRAVLRAADWKTDTELAARTALRTMIADHYLDQIFYRPRTTESYQAQENPRGSAVPANANQEPSRPYLSRRVQQEISDQARTWGVEIVKVTIDEIDIPKEVEKRIFELRNVEWVYDADAARTAAQLRLACQKAKGERKGGQDRSAGKKGSCRD